MKKVFELAPEGKRADRHLEGIRRDINKYVARERKKKLPEGFEVWDFECKFGDSVETAEPIAITEVTARITQYVADEKPSFYIEILSKPKKSLRNT